MIRGVRSGGRAIAERTLASRPAFAGWYFMRVPNLTKHEIVLEVYRKSGFPQKQIADTVQQTLDVVQQALANGRNVELRNFGVLALQVRKQRMGRNPNQPESSVVIPQRAVVKFKAGKILKQQLQKIDLTTLRPRS